MKSFPLYNLQKNSVQIAEKKRFLNSDFKLTNIKRNKKMVAIDHGLKKSLV